MKPDASKTLKRNILQRLFGKCATKEPTDRSCWTYSGGKLEIDLSRLPELSSPGDAVRLKGGNLPERVLIVHGDDGNYHAFKNRCTHSGRRLDPVPGAGTIQCCSVGKSTFDYSGKLLGGSAKDDVAVYAVDEDGGKLIVSGI